MCVNLWFELKTLYSFIQFLTDNIFVSLRFLNLCLLSFIHIGLDFLPTHRYAASDKKV